MAMEIGGIDASSGMTQAIYEQMAENMEPGLDGLDEAQKAPVREGWKKLAHAIATGVVHHLQENLQVRDLAGTAAPVLSVSGSTAAADPAAGHTHGAGTLAVTVDSVVFR